MVLSAPTYHIVEKVPVDLIQLGTIIDDLSDVFPLNENEEIILDEGRLFCEHETDFEATRAQILGGKAGIGLKVLAVQGGEASLGGERGVDDKYTFGAVDTLVFYPTPEDYDNAAKSKGLKGFLETSKYAPVYLITGIKTGRMSTIGLSRMKKIEGNVNFGVDTGMGISLMSKFDPSKVTTITQKADKAGDSILAIRVRKLSYKKKWLIAGPREWTNEAQSAGAELVGKIRGKEEEPLDAAFDVEEMELVEELKNCDVKTEQNQEDETITWVIPKA